jgi:TRAP-type C4-dicarboxylate transport system substrate-binding protein
MISIKRRTTLGVLALSIGMAPARLPAWAQTTPSRFRTSSPAAPSTKGDFRDRLCRMFAAEVEKRTKGA